jgi:hypothetical protein
MNVVSRRASQQRANRRDELTRRIEGREGGAKGDRTLNLCLAKALRDPGLIQRFSGNLRVIAVAVDLRNALHLLANVIGKRQAPDT